MALFFVISACVALAMNYREIPDAFALIFKEAFNFKSAAGGVAGYGIMAAMKSGFSRGVFSNEAGLGSSTIIHAQTKDKNGEKTCECGKVITCEEHNIIGGLGEAVCSLLSEKCPTPVRRIGVNDEFGHSGPAGALLKQFGLSAEHIVEVAKEFCGK